MNFYHVSYLEATQMEAKLFDSLFIAMVKLKARDRLKHLDNSVYAGNTYMNKEDRSRFHKKIYDEAQTEESINMEVARSMNNLGDLGRIKPKNER